MKVALLLLKAIKLKLPSERQTVLLVQEYKLYV